jgi:hypothetical protein
MFNATFIAIAGGIIGLAALAVLVSRNAQTPQVFTAAGNAFSSIIGAAVAPVTSSGGGFGSSVGS